MFYNNFDNVHGEDPWGMVGRTGDKFREDVVLNISCYRCGKAPLVIAERNWVGTNHDHSQRYEIMVACENCGAVDRFIVNDGAAKKISPLRHRHVWPSEKDIEK